MEPASGSTGGGWTRVVGTAALGGIGVLCKTPAVLLLGYLVLAQWWRGEGWSTTLGMKLGAVALPMVSRTSCMRTASG